MMQCLGMAILSHKGADAAACNKPVATNLELHSIKNEGSQRTCGAEIRQAGSSEGALAS